MMSLRQVVGDLDEAGQLPLYQQLARALRQAIDLKRLAADEALPAERDIAEEFQVSRFTVRRALTALAAEGRLIRRRGSGNYVAKSFAGRIEASFSRLTSLSEELSAKGRLSRSVWLCRAAGAATPEEADALDLAPGAAIHRLDRIRQIDGIPLIVEFCTLAGFALEDAAAIRRSIYSALEQRGVRPVRAEQKLRAVTLHGEQADRLGVRDGAGGLFVERRAHLADGRAVEFTRAYFRGDAFDFVSEPSAPRARRGA